MSIKKEFSQFFVSSRWRNNTHVSPMRIFSNLDKAIEYANTLPRSGEAIIYQLFSDKEPVKIPLIFKNYKYTPKNHKV